MPHSPLSVGQVAKRCDVKVSTLHFYEQKQLIHSVRNSGNQRRYKKDVLRRVSVIKAAQQLGISLQEIKQALDGLPDNRTPTKEDWAALSSHWHQLLNQRILQLENLKDALSDCIGCGCLSLSKCPLYNKDDCVADDGEVGAILLNRRNEKAAKQ